MHGFLQRFIIHVPHKRSGMTCVLQGFTVLPAIKHEPYLNLLPATEYDCPLAGTHCAYPRRDGQTELTWVTGYIPR